MQDEKPQAQKLVERSINDSWYKQGPFRPYKVIKQQRHNHQQQQQQQQEQQQKSSTTVQNSLSFTKTDYAVLVILAIIAVYTRLPLTRIRLYNEKELITMDILKMYDEGEFFLDIHPPLGRLIYYMIAKLTSYLQLAQEENQIGIDILDKSIVYLRLFSSLCGAASVIFIYFIMRKNSNILISLFTSLVLLLENSIVGVSRSAMLDSVLLLGQCMVIYSLRSFLRAEFYSSAWWKSGWLTGVALGWTISTKLNGWLTLIWALMVVAHELWEILGDLTITTTQWFIHVFWRIVQIMVIPLSLYTLTFWLHFEMTPKDGPQSGFVSPHFRSSLKNYRSDPVEVLYGSTITLKHNRLEQYLHSHEETYPTGSQLQQVTLYDFANDENNEWVVETPHKYYEDKLMKRVRPVKDGDVIRLYHKKTGHYLQINDFRPPISDAHDYAYEVSTNATRGLMGDDAYDFKVRIIARKSHAVNNLPLIKVRATETVFQLISKGQKCLLLGHDVKLPDWGYGQNEVVCIKEPTIPNSLWYIENNEHPMLTQMGDVIKKVDFGRQLNVVEKIGQVLKAALRFQNGFTVYEAYNDNAAYKKPTITTKPALWPLAPKANGKVIEAEIEDDPHGHKESGQISNIWGNAAIHCITTIVMIYTIIKSVFYIIRIVNPYADNYVDSPETESFYTTAMIYQLGWMIHYFPFFKIDVSLHSYNYIPALVFLILNLAEWIRYQNKYVGVLLMTGILGGVILLFFIN